MGLGETQQRERAQRPQPVRLGVAHAAAGVAVAAAGLPVTAIYAPGPLPYLICAAAAGSVAVTGALRAIRLPAAAAVGTSLVVLAGALLALGAWLPRPAGPFPLAVATAVTRSGAEILTSSLPTPVSLAGVALPLCATWLAGVAAAVALRSLRPSVSALPPVLLFGGVLALVGPVPSAAYGFTAALIAALVALFGVLGGRRIGRLGGVAITVVAVLLAGATVTLAPRLLDQVERRPPDPRAHIVPPYQATDEINPLSRLSGWAAEPEEPLLEVRTDRPTRLRWVTLSDFTGITWLPSATYRAAGALLPVPDGTAKGATVREGVTVLGLTGGWLPLPEQTSEVRGVRVAVDADYATVAAPDGLNRGVQYTLTAAPPEWSIQQLAAARLPSGTEFDRFRTLPAGAPARLNEIAKAAGGAEVSPYGQAMRLAAYLRAHYRFDARVPGGNGYPSLGRFLIQPVSEGGGRGTSEQFATAFAILARALGMPARVVVGFDSGLPLGDGRQLIRSGDARAWAEVYLDGLGWVTFDPTPAQGDSQRPPTTDELAETVTTEVPAAPPPGGDDKPAPEPSAPAQSTAADRDTGTGTMGISLAALAAVLILAVAAVPVLRVRRRGTRLGDPNPAARVLGAWSELRDGLRMIGRVPSGALVVSEVASLSAAAAVGPRSREQAELVAAAVNDVGFGGARPGDPQAERTVAAVRDLLREILHRSGPVRRWTWWLDPRPLWWR